MNQSCPMEMEAFHLAGKVSTVFHANGWVKGECKFFFKTIGTRPVMILDAPTFTGKAGCNNRQFWTIPGARMQSKLGRFS